jgi:curved DNA-binding protein CbpA
LLDVDWIARSPRDSWKAMRSRNGLYTLLQVLPDADPAVIEAAYKALMKKHHPDRLGGVDAERRAAEISHAFNVLRDPDRRADYDADERAREERYKVELSRVFPEPPPKASQIPARAEPRHRPANRVAAGIGAAGFLALAATIALLARGAPDAPSPVPLSAAMSSNPDAQAVATVEDRNIPFRDQQVSRGQVVKAVAEFKRIVSLAGLSGAADFSERCFEAQARSLDVNDFDYCVAFDHAAGRFDLQPSADLRSPAARRFQPQNQVSRHVRAADPMADTFSSIELRLFEIRRVADTAVSDLLSREASEGGIVPAAAPQRRYAADPAQPRPARPPRQQAKQEQDFLERQGGIY